MSADTLPYHPIPHPQQTRQGTASHNHLINNTVICEKIYFLHLLHMTHKCFLFKCCASVVNRFPIGGAIVILLTVSFSLQSYLFLLSSDYERSEWRESIQKLMKKGKKMCYFKRSDYSPLQYQIIIKK